MCEAGHDDIIERLESLEGAFREYNGELGEIQDDVTIIKNCIVGDIKKNNPGLAERLRSIEKWMKENPNLGKRLHLVENWIDGRKWFNRLIVTVLISQLILYVLIQLEILPK